MIICDKDIKVGDFVKVKYTKGKRFTDCLVSGTITRLWEERIKQAQLDNGWCFHDWDYIEEHKPL